MGKRLRSGEYPRFKRGIRARVVLTVGIVVTIGSIVGILWILGITPFNAYDEVQLDVTLICTISHEEKLPQPTDSPVKWRIILYDQGRNNYNLRIAGFKKKGTPYNCGGLIVHTNKKPMKILEGRFRDTSLSSVKVDGFYVTQINSSSFPLSWVKDTWRVEPHGNAFHYDDWPELEFQTLARETLFSRDLGEFWLELDLGELSYRRSFSEQGLSLHVRPGTQLFAKAESSENPADQYELRLSVDGSSQISTSPTANENTAQGGIAHLSWTDLYVNDQVDIVLVDPDRRRQSDALLIGASTVFGAGVSAILEALLAFEWLTVLFGSAVQGQANLAENVQRQIRHCTATTRTGRRCRNPASRNSTRCHLHRP